MTSENVWFIILLGVVLVAIIAVAGFLALGYVFPRV